MKHRAKEPLGRSRPLRKGLRVPGKEEWSGYENYIDVRYARKLFFGKTHSEVQKYFGGVQSIARASEPQYMPRGAFRYYVLAFAEFIKSDYAIGDSDSASCFLSLLLWCEKKNPGSVSAIFRQLEDAVALVSEGQKRFDASVDIYGRFSDLGAELAELAGAPQSK